MVQVLEHPLPFHKSWRLGVTPEVWKCGNPECNQLVSDVDRKSKFKKYCSTACRTYVNDNHRRERNHKKILKRKVEPRPCKACGKKFTPLKKRTAQYCSTICNIRVCRGNRVMVPCGNCGVQIKSMRNTQFCSAQCREINFHRTKLEELQHVRN